MKQAAVGLRDGSAHVESICRSTGFTVTSSTWRVFRCMDASISVGVVSVYGVCARRRSPAIHGRTTGDVAGCALTCMVLRKWVCAWLCCCWVEKLLLSPRMLRRWRRPRSCLPLCHCDDSRHCLFGPDRWLVRCTTYQARSCWRHRPRVTHFSLNRQHGQIYIPFHPRKHIGS